MANRQHGSRRRTARTVPVSRPPADGRGGGAGVPVCAEPEVRRWPHPVGEGVPAAQQPEPTLHYIRCALSYQNQLLADIKALLEQLAEQTEQQPED